MRSPPRRRLFRRLLLITAVIGLPAGGGSVYQSAAVRREAERFPPPGQLVEIGGRRLHVICIGEGSPVVLFEASGFGSALSAGTVRAEIAKRTRVCSYDRVGMGWSDASASSAITIGQLVDDLDRLLVAAHLPPPYVVVTASVGGLITELFARRHPEQVAGLLFLDAGNSVALERVLPRIGPMERETVCLARVAATIGIVRAVDPFGLRKENDERGISRLYRVEPMQTLCGLVRGAAASLEEFRAAPPLRRDVPLTVLIAGTPRGILPFGLRVIDPEDAQAAQRELSTHSTRGTWRVVERSGHLIASSQPDVVTAAVLELLKPR